MISFSCGGNNNSNNSCNCPATNKLCGMLRISRHNFISLPHCSHPPPPLVTAPLQLIPLPIVALMFCCSRSCLCLMALKFMSVGLARLHIGSCHHYVFYTLLCFFFSFLWVKIGVSFECNFNEARHTDCESA